LGAARAIDVAIIRINKTAFGAAENMILARRGTKTALPVLGIECEGGHCAQERYHITNEQSFNRHKFREQAKLCW